MYEKVSGGSSHHPPEVRSEKHEVCENPVASYSAFCHIRSHSHLWIDVMNYSQQIFNVRSITYPLLEFLFKF